MSNMLQESIYRVCQSAIISACLLAVNAQAVQQDVHLFPLQSIKLIGETPFTQAIKVNQEYLTTLAPDRLLAPFRREAGLEPKAAPYGSWESRGLDGHIAGHYLSALATMIAAQADTKDGELHKRLTYMVEELAECQNKFGDGYIGGIPNGHAMWKEISRGNIHARRFGLNGKWVPWYNIHKTMAGLRDASALGNIPKAGKILEAMGDWVTNTVAPLSDEQMQAMLGAEHGGMSEIMADIYAITGNDAYLSTAKKFRHRALLTPLSNHKDTLTRQHANTQIPKVLGMHRIGNLTNNMREISGAKFFWKTVVEHRSVAFGGNSVDERFNHPDNFRPVLESRTGPETCNTHNMLRLTSRLFCNEPNAKYADFYERALYNHILSSIHPTKPGLVYFTPLRPGHYRVYSQPELSFWCCVGTGIEGPGRFGEFIYASGKESIYVNLYVNSQLSIDKETTLVQTTQFPDEEVSRISLSLAKPKEFSLYLRLPRWLRDRNLRVRINGKHCQLEAQENGYAKIHREWRNEDCVEVNLPMKTTCERLPDGSPWVAILKGPIVLACKAGEAPPEKLRAADGRGDHIPAGKLLPLDKMPVILGDEEEVPRYITPTPGEESLRFSLTNIAQPKTQDTSIKLLPLFQLHDSRYQAYWKIMAPESYEEEQKLLAEREKKLRAIEEATLDRVDIGAQQSEIDHLFAGEETRAGEYRERTWRHGKWFQYTLSIKDSVSPVLVVTYWGRDRNRKFSISANGKKLAHVHLDGSQGNQFFQERYTINPSYLSKTAPHAITIRFAADKDSIAGGVYGLRVE